jgi:hypothetical protein
MNTNDTTPRWLQRTSTLYSFPPGVRVPGAEDPQSRVSVG